MFILRLARYLRVFARLFIHVPGLRIAMAEFYIELAYLGDEDDWTDARKDTFVAAADR